VTTSNAERIRTADVIIVGGGIVGSAVAYHLSRTTGRHIVLIERDPSYANGSTARSAGGVRQQFSTPENIALSQATLSVLRQLRSEFGAEADVSFREQGYLILASATGHAMLAQNVARQDASGADIVLLNSAGLAQQFPWLATDGITSGSFGRSGEGWIDPVGFMSLLRKAAVAAGVTVVTGDVTEVHRTGSKLTGVTLTDGRSFHCASLVNAAGPYAGALAAMAEVALPVEPRKRFVYVIDSRRATEAMRQGPLTVDPSGVWFRPEGRVFLCGVSPDDAAEPSIGDLDLIDYAPFEDIVWPALAARVPAFEEAKLIRAWAGYYDYNTLDQNAIIGAHPTLANFYFCNGFSGHGLQQAYAAGRAVAELILQGRFTTLDLSRFGYVRVARGEPLFELNVI
jgi:FAD-dependent oxidoreductase domain-containing protein 1